MLVRKGGDEWPGRRTRPARCLVANGVAYPRQGLRCLRRCVGFAWAWWADHRNRHGANVAAWLAEPSVARFVARCRNVERRRARKGHCGPGERCQDAGAAGSFLAM